jgi:hypothetical protein
MMESGPARRPRSGGRVVRWELASQHSSPLERTVTEGVVNRDVRGAIGQASPSLIA